MEFVWETQSQEFYDSEDDLDERVSLCPAANKAFIKSVVQLFRGFPRKHLLHERETGFDDANIIEGKL